MLGLVVIGLTSLPTLKRETFPDFAPQEVQVTVPYPGASALDVEEAVCRRLEDAVDGISHVYEVRCESREGAGVAVVRMGEGGDFSRFLDDVKTEVQAIDNFPDETKLPVIRQLGITDQVVSIAITGPMSVGDLKAYAEEVKSRLKRLDEVSQVTIQGFSERQLRVQVPAHALRRYGLSPNAIADAIARQSVDLPAGSIRTRERDLLVRFTDQRRTPEELGSLIVVGGGSGAEVRLGDIATITDQFELDEEKILFDGRRAALLQVTKTKAEDTLRVVDAVETFLVRERGTAPPEVRFTLTQNVSSIVRDRLEMLTRNGLQGLVLVFLVMALFFHLRFAFWVAMGLPVSFLGALFFMSLIGYSVNMITMVALLIALGLLMDDAIVIAENVATQLRKGKAALEAAVDGVTQVAPGVFASFLTTAAVFGPLAFLEGDIGKVLRVMPVVLVLVLAVSFVEAFLILPHHLAHAMRHAGKQHASRFRERFEAGVDRVREEVLGAVVDRVIEWRYAFVGVVLAVFLASLGMLAGGHLKFQAFPDIEGDVLEARILLPQGTPLWRTEQLVSTVVDALGRVDEEFSVLQRGTQRLVRSVNVRFNENLDAHEQGAHVATVTADLLPAEQRTGSLGDVTNRWREETGRVPDAISLNFKEPHIGPAGLAVEIRLSGEDLADLKGASRALREWLGRYQGVFDLGDDLRPGKPELRLQLREGALAIGLDASTIAQQLRAAFYGTTAKEIQVGPESYEIDVRLKEFDQGSLVDLEDFRVTAADGSQVPLGAVTSFAYERGFARIQRIDGRRTVTVRGDVDPRLANAAQVVADTRARFLPELAAQFPSVEVSLEGQSRESARTGASLARGFLVGLVGVFILLSFLFRSYVEPLVVMVAIPLALVGVVWGHVLMGLEMSMPSMMGFVSLSGIVVNDSILLVTFLKLRAREGHRVPEAAKLASRERFRAVLLTSLTTIAGLLPLLTERSLQAQVLIPLATSIVFGLLASTVLVLLVVPALMSILDDFGWTSVSRAGPERREADVPA